MRSAEETTIRVPVAIRDEIKAEASRLGVKQADLLSLALRELKQAQFLRSVAAVEWDDEAAAEAAEWDAAGLAGELDPWESDK
ncbi:MAG: hypothetical protein LBC97_08490 [Bifidobacteriaceae bacterium]|jgi:hypothetical protein|nr:hypothetical protein [Bifidobacteriaceae bacterium]